MNRATPRLRDFAERLISIGVIEAKSSALKRPAVFTVIEELRPSLEQVVGALGFSAVFSRALAIANADVAWLRAVHVKPDGSLEGLDELEANVDPKEIAEGRVVLLAEFVSLLVALIGERLVLQLVHQAMPKVSRDDLYFGEGSDHEKKVTRIAAIPRKRRANWPASRSTNFQRACAASTTSWAAAFRSSRSTLSPRHRDAAKPR